MFAFVRWASNDYGTIVSRIDVLRAVAPGQPLSTVPFVRPGAEILLRISGWPRVEQVLAALGVTWAAFGAAMDARLRRRSAAAPGRAARPAARRPESRVSRAGADPD